MVLIKLSKQESDDVIELVKVLNNQCHNSQSMRHVVNRLHHIVRQFNETEIEVDHINYPSHYTHGSIEVIDYIEDQGFCYHLGNAVGYISRANHKGHMVDDLRKAVWFINRKIKKGEEKNDHST